MRKTADHVRSFILGSDWWTDCDDAVAIRILVRASLRGDIRLLGIGLNACMPLSVRSLGAFLLSEGLPGLPVGIDRAATDFGGHPPYQARLAARPSPFAGNDDAEDAVRLYRRLLASADGPVELLEIGYPQVLAALLASPPDDLSPLPGSELLRATVPRLWMMAGRWDQAGGRENNFSRNRRASEAAHALCAGWPTPVTFLGWEVGVRVVCGGALREGDPLRDVLADHGSPRGRFSWDPMLVRLACLGDPAAAGYRLVRGRADVDPDTGANHFSEDPDGPHGYVMPVRDPTAYQEELDALIVSTVVT